MNMEQNKKYLETNNNENMMTKTYGMQKNVVLKGAFKAI